MRHALTPFPSESRAPARPATKRAVASVFIALGICALATTAAANDYTDQNNTYESDHAEAYAAYPAPHDDPAYESYHAGSSAYEAPAGYDPAPRHGAYGYSGPGDPAQPPYDSAYDDQGYGHHGHGYEGYGDTAHGDGHDSPDAAHLLPDDGTLAT